MPSWEDIQLHARRFIDEGLKMLRSGMTEASYLADATAKAANLHVALRKNRLERYKAVHEIGKFVCAEVDFDHTKDSVRLTDHIKQKMEQVIALDREASEFEEQISGLTVIRKGEAKPKAAKSKKSAKQE